MQAAIVASTIANVNRPAGKAAYKIAAFVPEFGETEKEAMTTEEMEAALAALTKAMGGEVKSRG